MLRRHRQQICLAAGDLEFFNQPHQTRLAPHRIEHLIQPLLQGGVPIDECRVQPA